MSKKKKITLGVGFIVFLVALWVAVYFICLSVEPKGDNVITKEQLESMDKSDSIFYEATVTIDDKDYSLSDLTEEVIGDNIVVKVEVNNRQVQGYVTFSDVITKAEVKLEDSDSYAQLILPESVNNTEISTEK